MGCCATRSDRPGRIEGRRLASAEIVEIADAAPPPRAEFAGGRSHVGTRSPAIPEDGEGPPREVRLKPFACDTVPVTNARFAAFVAATGYVTEAERLGWGQVFAPLMADPSLATAAFPGTPWWVAVPGASWHAPEGPGSGLAARADHPVVHVSAADAAAFAAWAGGRLPGEAEWEHAARGGLPGDPRFPWGAREPDDADFLPANIWQGRFPVEDTGADGHRGTSPVGAYPPNGAGLHDMAGNVWEWTADAFRVRSRKKAAEARNARARSENMRVMKGGSFLCHASYCYRYRIAARSAVAADSGASNTGFRVFYDCRASAEAP
ncbi:formylglycine-generating enzyme family protein [Wenxinia saemankumensis]|uniref:Formylglycine-generating enzyme, required for sulfatase activity, contains SUMF1/FGE domain n=1 Tax=Wenxinia saemankumensis TaxID=1447782 RepID=A0A1M6AE91_9RHOB|nr:formylglycine-generating enzyme family protein [Wenxinia saemankumensis]SHI34860.1 Formylglycine-generating enzyme, required for sulfatase activity, contains SUMF1/FGE domain [Wenxinia saemankumensis]